MLDVEGAHGTPLRANFLVEFINEVVIVDPCTPNHQINAGVTHIGAMIEDLVTPDCGKLDHIVLSNVHEHIDAPKAVLKSVVRLLKIGGQIHF